MRKLTAIQIALGTLAGAALVTTGVVAGLKYWTGSDFSPSGSTRELKTNQVLFQQEPDPQATNGNDGQDDSSRWEKQEEANRQESPQLGEGNFLFQTDNSGQASSTGGIAGDAQGGAQGNGQAPDHIFDIGGSGGGSIGTDGSLPGTGDGKGDGDGDGDYVEPTWPEVLPQDPVPDKEPPSDYDPTYDYIYREDGFVPANHPWIPGLNYVAIEQDYYGTYSLYKGQTVGEKEIFASLSASFYSEEWVLSDYGGGYFIYNRHILTGEHYGKYIRVTGVSFDGGNTWVEDFPATIPTEIGDLDFWISVDYRFYQSSEEWFREEVPYILADSKVMVLSGIPDSGLENIPQNLIMNGNNPYPSVGSTVNLLEYQATLLGLGDSMEPVPLTRLFSGWYENGKAVPWIYTVTPGRHVLMPGGYASISGSAAMLEPFLLNENWESDPASGNAVFLQTMTDGTPDANGVLKVRKFFQAVNMQGKQVRVLQLPDTVVYIPNETGSIQVTDAFQVEAGNPRYSSQDGILMNADKTEILGVPTSITEWTVGAEITKIAPLRGNALKKLVLEGTVSLPEIQYDCLPDGLTLVVPENLMGELMDRDGAALKAHGVVVQGSDGRTYHASGLFLMDEENGVCGLLRDDQQIATLPEETKFFRTGSFSNSTVLTTLMLPPQMEAPQLEEGCFTGGALTKILCGTQEQVESLRKQMEELGIEGVVASMLESKDGFTYADLGDGTVRLVSAPKDESLTEFTGLEGLTISEIGSEAFAGCESLRWVTIPEGIRLIEESAFAGCTSLEGILLQGDPEDGVTLQSNMLEGCSALRVFASNATKAAFQGSLGEGLSYVGFFPWDGEGYPLTEVFHAVTWLKVENCAYGYLTTESGQRTMYGFENGVPMALLEMEYGVSGAVKLPGTTAEICPRAFDGQTGTFTVNWTDFGDFSAIDYGAFRNSGLSGDVDLSGRNIVVDSNAFLNCAGLTSFRAAGTFVGDSAFEGCNQLKTVDLGTIVDKLVGEKRETGTITMGAFSGCGNLKSISVANLEPPPLTIRSPGTPFYLIGDDPENLLHVPEEARERYVEAWAQPYTGYATEEELRAAYYWVDEEEKDRMVASMLRKTRNEIRRLIDGLEPVPSVYRVEEDEFGILTLVGVREPVAGSVILDEYTMDTSGYLDYIAAGALAGCPDLTQVTLQCDSSAYLSGIYSGAFPTGGEALELVFAGDTAPTLLLDENESFSFGLEDGKITLTVAPEYQERFLAQWKANLAGFASYDDALDATRMAHPDWNETRVQQTTDSQLLAGENRLRAMMGLELAEDPLGHFEYESIRNDQGIRLNGVPTYVENITLDKETMGLTKDRKLLEINADSFEDCDLLKKVTVPNTVDAITSRAFTCSTERLTLDMTAWTKEKTPPKLVLLDLDRDGEKEPFSFGLRLENAQVTVLVQDEETKQNFIDAWALAFAGAESREALERTLLQSLLRPDMTQEEQDQAASTARDLAENAIAQAKSRLNELISVPTPPEEVSSGENGVG